MINNIPISISIQAVASDQNSQDYIYSRLCCCFCGLTSPTALCKTKINHISIAGA